MNIIKNFESEAIATFELSVFGQEILLFEDNHAFVLLPFHKLGYYDDIKGISHNYNLGYFIFEGVKNYKIRKCQYRKDGTQDIRSKVSYDVGIDDTGDNNYSNFEISDMGLNPIGLIWQSLKIDCRMIHIVYDFIENDCTSTDYLEVANNKEINSFLLTYDLYYLQELLSQIKKMG
jgi:hypothetical protein